MLHLKSGGQFSTNDLRTVLFRNVMDTIYEIHLIHYTLNSTNLVTSNEGFACALSRRPEDQVEDVAGIPIGTMIESAGIFGLFSVMSDVATTGGAALVGNHTISFPKPYDVPFLAWVVESDYTNTIRASVEIWFERRRATAEEMAQLSARAGINRTFS